MLIALERRIREGAGLRALFGLGYTFGFVFYLIGTHWIALLSDVAITVPWLKYPAWVAAGAYLAIYAGLTTMLAGWLASRRLVALAFAFPLALIVISAVFLPMYRRMNVYTGEQRLQGAGR